MHNLKTIADRVLYLNRKLDPVYVRDVARQAHEEIWRSRRWSFRRRTGQITAVSDYSTGGILTLTQADTAVTGTGTTWTAAMVGRHLRPTNNSSAADIRDYRITVFGSTTTLTIENPYEGSSISSSTAYTIYQKEYRLPPDFAQLEVPKQTVGPVVMGIVTRAELEAMDPIDNQSGDAYWLADAGYSTTSLYSTGTVTMTVNDTAVTGSGTTFVEARDKGRRFRVRAYPQAGDFTITAVGGGTSITLDRAWPFDTKSTLAFDIDPPGERLVEIYPRPDANSSIQMYYFRNLPPLERDSEISQLPPQFHDLWLKRTMMDLGMLNPMEYEAALGELLMSDGLSTKTTIRPRPMGADSGVPRSLLSPDYPAYWPKGYR